MELSKNTVSASSNIRHNLLLTIWTLCVVAVPDLPAGAMALSKEGEALLQIKASMEDPLGRLSDWMSTDSFPCAWTGVTCNTSGAVTALDISQKNLSGSLTEMPLLTLAPALVSFNVCCNSLTGNLPAALFNGAMESLVSLDISRNYFTGSMPIASTSTFSSSEQLTFFSAFSNNLTGPIPANLAFVFPNLEHLDLGGSFLSGQIPPNLANLSSLAYLSLSGNLLTGQIPSSLSALSKMRSLLLSYNKLLGAIPAELSNLTSLNYLDFCCNNLSGSIPPEIGLLDNLNTLFLYKNLLSGSIPSELGSMTSLMSLDLSINNLSGSIPSELGNLHHLTLLSLMYNRLSGSLPDSIALLPNLLTLLIWNNSFTGQLPQALGMSSALQWLDASSNNFQGPIPPHLCSHNNLSKLILFSNSFSGQIPASLAQCQSLLRVRVHDNQLSGSIPPGFGSLAKLTRLEFQYNQLSGSIPADICNSPKLNYLDISMNRISGELPANLWQLPDIQTLLAFGNNISSSIPSEFSTACLSLTVLSLAQNSLTGEIPPGISTCQKLVTIQLQENELSGSIPAELATMPNLAVLDLSQNHLTGLIPYQFQNLTTLEFFNVSYNNLSGPVPLSGMFKTASLSSFLGNPYLCGGMLPTSCIALEGFGQFTGNDKRKSPGPMWLVGCVFSISFLVLIAGARFLYKQYGPRFCSKDIFEDMDEWPWRLTAFQRLSFTSNDVLDALKDENIIGRGATGVVYKASMPSGEVVAVKKLWSSHKGGIKSYRNRENRGFQIEVDLLGSIRHRNIVRLLGYCSNNVSTLLIYEYMTNGSLEDALHAKGRPCILVDWVTRYNIAMGIAQGLCYLHHDCFPQVVHRDVKSNNILLDCNMEARVADFGVAKLVEANEPMSMIAGSYGYIAPEYAYTLKVDEKTDIYSFGVILLELLTGKKPIESEFGDAINIVEWVRSKVRSKVAIVDALDATVGASCSTVQEEMLLVLRIALLCTSKCPRDRPTMRDVVTMLAEAKPRRKNNNAVDVIEPTRSASGPLNGS